VDPLHDSHRDDDRLAEAVAPFLDEASMAICRFVGFGRDVLLLGHPAPGLSEAIAAQGNRIAPPSSPPADAFDAVVLCDVVDPDHSEATLRDARGGVRAGGCIVISATNASHVARLLPEAADASPGASPADERLPVISWPRLAKLLGESGLRVSAIERQFQAVAPAIAQAHAGHDDDIERLLADPEGETTRFVVRAKRIEDDLEVAELEARLLEADDRVRRSRREARRFEGEVARAERVGLDAHAREIELLVELDAVNADRQRLRTENEMAELDRRSLRLDLDVVIAERDDLRRARPALPVSRVRRFVGRLRARLGSSAEPR